MSKTLLRAHILLLSALCLFVLSSCNEDDDTNGGKQEYSDLPQVAKNFLEFHFSNQDYSDIEKYDIAGDNGKLYNVKLADKTIEIDFDSEGNFLSVKSDKGLPVSVFEILDTNTKAYINNKYKNYIVQGIEKKIYGYKVDLDKSESMAFNEAGLFIGIDANTTSNLPQTALEFTEKYVPDATVNAVVVETDTDYMKTNYLVFMSNGYYLEFDSNGKWMYVNFGEEILPDALVDLLPENLFEHFDRASVNFIAIANRQEGLYEVTYLNKSDGGRTTLTFMASNHQPEVAISEVLIYIQVFLTEHFQDVHRKIISFDPRANPKLFNVELSNGFLLIFDQQKNLLKIDGVGQTVPEVIAATNFPSAIAPYIKVNYSGLSIRAIEKVSAGFIVTLSDSQKLSFDTEGAFAGKI